jgi:omega-6 fatty acid desaturase (delta-12 desaturase)
MARFVRPNTFLGVAYFLFDYGLWLAAIAGVLFLPVLWMKIAAGLAAGLKQGTLMVIAHDAAHNNTTASKKLNSFISIVCFMPTLFNYRLWLYDHNKTHHYQTNDPHRDLYKPFSKSEFDALPRWRQVLEKVYRTPFGMGLYYILERFPYFKLFPTRFFPKQVHRKAWFHFWLLTVYVVSFVAFLAAAPIYSETSSLTAVLLGFFLPFYVAVHLFSFTTYMQHSHPEIPWFDNKPDRKVFRQEDISAHIVFPKWYQAFSYHIHEHPIHHVNPGIPFYRAGEAQSRLNEIMGEQAVSTRWTPGWYLHCMRTCRLYDFENHRWLDWDGTPLTGCLLRPHLQRRLEEKHAAQEEKAQASGAVA